MRRCSAEATGTWDDITTVLDTAASVIGGERTSFSFFLLSEPNQPPSWDLGGPYEPQRLGGA